DAPYANAYGASLRAKRSENTIFTGYVFGDGYRELSANAYCFVETSEVGGTHPALVEAMGFGSCVVANGIPENLETMGRAGFSYTGPRSEGTGREGAKGLVEVLQQLVDNPKLVEERRQMSLAYAREKYTWETDSDDYVTLF